MFSLFVAGIVLWLSILGEARTDFPFELMLGLAVTVVGLGSGLGSRLAFGGRSRALQIAGALGAGVLGLYALGYLTDWRMGIGPVQFWRDQIDRIEAAQFAGVSFASLLAASAWRRQVRVRGGRGRSNAALNSPARSAEYVSSAPRRGLTSTANSSAGTRGAVRSSRAGSSPRVRPGARAQSGALKFGVRQAVPRSSSRKRGIFRRRPAVQFSVYEEHKCPYCLEDVKRNDPRGVQECSICHTLHHADCWAITGMCQVPHLTT